MGRRALTAPSLGPLASTTTERGCHRPQCDSFEVHRRPYRHRGSLCFLPPTLPIIVERALPRILSGRRTALSLSRRICPAPRWRSNGVMTRADDYLEYYRTAKDPIPRQGDFRQPSHSLDRELRRNVGPRMPLASAPRPGDHLIRGTDDVGCFETVSLQLQRVARYRLQLADRPGHQFGQATNGKLLRGLYPSLSTEARTSFDARVLYKCRRGT